MEKIRVVLVKHPGCTKQFMFKVPEKEYLKPGDRVLCETVIGPCEMGTCTSASFDITESQLRDLWGRDIKKIKPIVGELLPVMYVWDSEAKAYDKD